MAGVCWKLCLLLEDSIQGGQDFAGGCSELYISLCKNDGVVCACAVCVTGSVDWFWSVCAPQTHLKESVILISTGIVILYATKRHMFLLFIDCIL